jgi:CRISPR-associated protein Cmr4
VEQGKALVTRASTVCPEREVEVVLEEYTFKAEKHEIADAVARWLVEHALPDGDTYRYWRSKLFTEAGGEVKSNLVILSDADFRDFTLFATEILTRIRINPATGTVAPGALWTEEHLPPDSLLYTVILGADPHANAQGVGGTDAASVIRFVVSETDGKIIQMGGDATVGRGLVRVRAFAPGR